MKRKPRKKTPAHEKTQDMFTALAGNSRLARSMAEVEEFRSVPTIFTSFNRASQVAGAPLSCLWLVHGPPGGGKTAFLCGLIRSFQKVNGLASFIDAELAADTKNWFRSLGVDPSRCLYLGRTGSEEEKKALTYEDIVKESDQLIDRYQVGKRDGSIPMGTPYINIVDSISKMVPEELFKKLDKEGGSALRSGAGRLQALLNTAWMMELGPKVGDDDILFAIISHEMESQDASKWTPDFKVRGGQALIYDAMVQIRVSFAGQVKDYSADGSPMVGKRHRVRILKNKHGPAYGEAIFYTSNGNGMAPMGFDRPREVVHEGLRRGHLQGPKADGNLKLTAGTSITWGDEKFQLKKLYTPEGLELVEKIAQRLDSELLEEDRDAIN